MDSKRAAVPTSLPINVFKLAKQVALQLFACVPSTASVVQQASAVTTQTQSFSSNSMPNFPAPQFDGYQNSSIISGLCGYVLQAKGRDLICTWFYNCGSLHFPDHGKDGSLRLCIEYLDL